MNKNDLVSAVAEHAELSKQQAGAAVDAVFEAIESAMSKGGYPAFRCIRSLVRLMEYCDSHQREPRDMTDSELNDELASLVAGLIETQPERVIEPLTRRSWRVTPPEASETLESGPESRH